MAADAVTIIAGSKFFEGLRHAAQPQVLPQNSFSTPLHSTFFPKNPFSNPLVSLLRAGRSML